MSLTALFAPERRTLEGTRPLSAANILEWLGGTPSATGKRVSEEGALRLGVVYTCTLIIADGVASLPLPVYRRLGDREKERAVDHPAYPLLNRRPNPWMNAYTLRQTLQGHLCLWGNAFAEILRDGNGRLTGLFPLRPDRMSRPRLAASGDLLYPYTLPSGEGALLPSSRVLHLRGLSCDGLWGYSPVALQREAIALGLTAEEFAAKFFGNMANPSGVLQVKGTLSPEGATRLATSWQTRHGGLENAHRVAVLEEGVEWKQVGMPLQDAQFLEQRQFERSEIAGWFRVPPHMIGDVEKQTSWGTGVEAQTLGFVTFTLRPWLVNWEQQLSIGLLTEPEQARYFIEHLIEGLLRGDTAARQAFYTALLDRGVFSINDVRALENQNPVDGGDERFVQANMIPLSMAGEQYVKDQPAPAQGAASGNSRDVLGDAGDTVHHYFGSDPSEEIESRAQDPRAHLREVYRPLFRDAAERVVERETAAIRQHGLPRLEQRDAASFNSWLEQFYREDLSPFIERIAAPILAAYGAATEREVLAELDIPALTEELAPFLSAYVASMASSYIGRSQGQLNQIVRQALADQADVRAAIEERLAEWVDKRPDKIADIESVRAGEAVAHKTYRRAGVRRLVWKTSGRNCPFCARLNGKTVRIDETFVSDGEELEGKEGEPKMRVRGSRMHAPIHARCNCSVGPA